MMVGVGANEDGTKVLLSVVNHEEETVVELEPEYAKKLAAHILVTAWEMEGTTSPSQM